ncbi:peptide chain release factor 2 [Candidatus Poribacteria bacterium]|nr:peptide chain release factor 2 [Candidatus Poribacteria bacterium]MBT5533117.1 peptide chain release factor 2 [Candidatus Poribacteria bacterium]MBT5713152.1 peptide chain release factor 2 [Candidatus Poribacteria bacterium]MBT7097915.1 peptide chain release factor 2 [Candidatus Poribacteria bacterium]MBT7805558.1 peptide chain release factor 2 [Candidatus Poribacteria bacterium]
MQRSQGVCWNCEVIFDVDGKQAQIAELNEKAGDPDFWTDTDAAQKVQRSLAALQSSVDGWSSLHAEIEDAAVLAEMADEEGDEDTLSELSTSLDAFRDLVEKQELSLMLDGEHDARDALVTIHPGAGGTESQDWAAMLLRMYFRYCETHEYKAELLDQADGDQAGIKSATFAVEGPFAFGYLRSEAGIHRLVRISPFDANKRRHTSFAAVTVTPDLDDDLVVELADEDIRVDTFRAGGPGGQHVNMTDSAVRMTHLPTGIIVVARNERSQHKNRATALRVLRSRVYAHFEAEQAAELAKMHGEKSDIAFGHQIRSYVFQPYQMVKDHRTDVEVGNVNAVMGGAIQEFIHAYLKMGPEKAS